MTQGNVLAWLVSAGGWYDETALDLQDYPGMGQGAVALRDLEEDTPLFSVPSSLLLSAEHSDLRTHLSSADWKDLVDAGGWTALIMCMMWEDAQGERSRWYGYMRSLPERFDTPMFWSEDDLRWLEGTDIPSKVGKTSAEETYKTKIVPLLQKYPEVFTPDSSATHRTIPHFSVDDFHVQGSRMLSRSFSVPKETVKPDPIGDVSMQSAGGDDSIEEGSAAMDDVESANGSVTAQLVPQEEGQDGGPEGSHAEDDNDEDEDEEGDDDDDDSEADLEEEVMVPVADVLNAAYGLDNAHLSFDDGRCKMITTKRIPKGEQIYNTYGGPSNSYLLRRYGHIDALPLPPVLLKKLSPELRTWPHGNIADDFEISGKDVLEAVVADWKQTRKGKITEEEDQTYQNALLERVDRWLEASGFGDTFVVEYDVEEALDEMIPFVKLLIMDSATFQAGKAKQKIPKAKIEGDDEGKRVIRILKRVMDTQRQGMGSDAKASSL
ncbi:hypothetical protein QFC24_001560 [Naganishia onofrii]|uniref:Uncharacterized protein n=1 Tax=Naganishia onofrii TaxID=1851511 RepID=A0ACC2XR84_9TREE|nr:hypothetical protein QFC24_001560 [Naganishia onofrii]